MDNEQSGPVQGRPAVDYSNAVSVIHQWRLILNTRLMLLLAVFGALAVFGFTIGDPTVSRQWASGIYAVTVLWPTIILYYRKG